MKKMAEKKKRWMSLGHGEYSEIHSEKDFFTVVKASERVVCHFYRENWPCKVNSHSCFQHFTNLFGLIVYCFWVLCLIFENVASLF